MERLYLDNFCKNLDKEGWEQLEPRRLDGVIILEIFKRKIKEINRELFEKYGEDEIFPKLISLLQNSSEENILNFLKYGATIIIKKWNSLIPVTINLIDYGNINNNQFNYIREQEFVYGKVTDRPDITLFINGIPIVVIEGKNPLKPTAEYQYIEALKQIMRYQKEIPNLFKFVQIGIGAGERNPYIPTFPRREIKTPNNYSFWKINREENIFHLLKKETLTNFIKYFIFFSENKKGEKIKIAARYMQYFATEKVIKRTREYLEKNEDKNKGLVWHWQGSGKTLTMFFIANQFLHVYQKRNPLVFLVIDRLDLQKQLETVVKSIKQKRFGKVEVIESIEKLRETIENIENEWGIRIVTIHKFQPKELDISSEVEKKEILFLIDEAHRSQYGDLAAAMRKIFKNSMFVGFTGTPIFKKEKNTFRYFAYPEKKEFYLDVYFIKQSQEDGFTLPISYRLIEEGRGIRILLTEEELRAIIQSYDTYGELTDKIIEGEIAKKIKSSLRKKITHSKIFLKNEKRIEKVVKYIEKNIEEDTENFKFKAMIVAVDREACVIYKEKMDKCFPEHFSEVVMSYQQNEESDKIHSFRSKILNRWNVYSTQEANKKIVEAFLKEEYPKVLIVTDMLLTGFDAPILKVMYLDKPMYYHTLLQAIARVNRVYPELDKRKGLIVDSVGLIKHIHATLHLYEVLADETNESIKEDLKNVFQSTKKDLDDLSNNINFLKEKLKERFSIDVEQLITFIKNNDDPVYIKDLKEKISYMALLYEKDEDVNEIIKLMKDTLKLYRSLGAEPEKLEYLWEIKIFSIIYYTFWKIVNKNKRKVVISKELWDSVVEWIHKSMIIDDIKTKFEKDIKVDSSSNKRIRLPVSQNRVADYFYSLRNETIYRLSNPLYKEIYLRLERLRESWMNRNINIEEFMKELGNIDNTLKRYKKIEEKTPWERITEFMKEYLKEKTDQSIDLKKVSDKLKEIFERKRFLDRDKKELNILIAKSLLGIRMDAKARIELENELMDMITAEIRRNL